MRQLLCIATAMVLIAALTNSAVAQQSPGENVSAQNVARHSSSQQSILQQISPQQISPKLYQDMKWRMIGPFRGGRSLAAAGVPGQPNVYYFGAVGGGVWKTTNAGETWMPLFDQQRIASIGTLAIAPSNPDVIYVGSGEADMRSDITFGNGVYKSADAGRTWQNIGLRDTQQIGRIFVDPRNPDIVLVAALGHAYGPNAERGVFRSTDGGRSWNKVLYKDENTGAIDLAADPQNPQVIYAALWNAHRPPWSTYPPVGGPGSGLYKSVDGGATWKQITGGGLPGGDWGRVGIAVGAAKNVKRIYVSIDAKDGGIFRSDDEGKTWTRVGTDPRVRTRLWYFSGITVDPQNPEILYVCNVALYRSQDGGKTFEATKGAPGGDDYHSLWIDPSDSRRMILATDQGTILSVDGGATWSSWFNQPTAQMYHVATDNEFPYYVYGAQQDSGTVATKSRSDYGAITYRDWYSVGAGESGYIVPDPGDPNIVYGGGTYGELFRFDKRTGQAHDISPLAVRIWGQEMQERKLRFTWTSPLAFSPQDPHTLYFGSQYVLKTTDSGASWQAISPDLTGATNQSCPKGAALTPQSAKSCGYGVVYAIAPSPRSAGEIWVGSDTGLIHLTRDGGKTWTNVTPKGLDDWSKISIIEASVFDAGTAYVAVDRHRLDDYEPLIFRTRDFGKTWEKIANGISAPAYVRAVREDPARRGLLYAATELGVYVSFDDGDHWQSLQLNMPIAPVHDLIVHGDDLVVATHGRSFWILDNLTPLRQAGAEMANAQAALFRPQTALRVRQNVNNDTPLPPETPAGQNPPRGATVDYYIGADSQGEVALEVLDAKGALVRRYASTDRFSPPAVPPPFTNGWLRTPEPLPASAGMHRVSWDLRYAAPPNVSHEYSAATVYGDGAPALPEGPIAPPGDYQLRLTVAGHSYTQSLKLQMDPRVVTPLADLQRQFAFEQEIAGAMVQDYRALQQAQALRTELKNVAASPGGGTYGVDVRGDADALDHKLNAFIGGAGSDDFSTINRNLGELLTEVDGADAAPTRQAQEAFQQIGQQLQARIQAWSDFTKIEVATFNDLLNKAGLEQLKSYAGGGRR